MLVSSCNKKLHACYQKKTWFTPVQKVFLSFGAGRGVAFYLLAFFISIFLKREDRFNLGDVFVQTCQFE